MLAVTLSLPPPSSPLVIDMHHHHHHHQLTIAVGAYLVSRAISSSPSHPPSQGSIPRGHRPPGPGPPLQAHEAEPGTPHLRGRSAGSPILLYCTSALVVVRAVQTPEQERPGGHRLCTEERGGGYCRGCSGGEGGAGLSGLGRAISAAGLIPAIVIRETSVYCPALLLPMQLSHRPASLPPAQMSHRPASLPPSLLRRCHTARL